MSHHIYDHAHRVISIYRLCTVFPMEYVAVFGDRVFKEVDKLT